LESAVSAFAGAKRKILQVSSADHWFVKLQMVVKLSAAVAAAAALRLLTAQRL
jgi:hypothetical protein